MSMTQAEMEAYARQVEAGSNELQTNGEPLQVNEYVEVPVLSALEPVATDEPIEESNVLPDGAFLYVKSIQGDPRALRLFPVRRADGSLDNELVLRALKEIPNSDLSDGLKNAAYARAVAMANSTDMMFGDVKVKSHGWLDMITKFVHAIRPQRTDVPVISLKEIDGRTRFLCTFTNCFEDKESAIFATGAHKEYAEWVEKSGISPELWLWHVPGTRLGVADWVAETDGLLFSSGLVDEGKELLAYELAGSKDIAMSHGFIHARRDGKVINWYRSYEMSLLPRDNAANDWTTFTLLGEKDMAFSAEQRAFLIEKGHYTEDDVKQLEGNASAFKDTMIKLGIDMKSEDEAQATDLQLLVKGQQQLTEAVNALAGVVVELKGQAVSADQKATEALAVATKSTDDIIAEHMTTQISRLPQGTKATDETNTGNVVEEAKAQAELNWFNELVVPAIKTSSGVL